MVLVSDSLGSPAPLAAGLLIPAVNALVQANEVPDVALVGV